MESPHLPQEGELLDQQVSALRLAGATLAADHDTLTQERRQAQGNAGQAQASISLLGEAGWAL